MDLKLNGICVRFYDIVNILFSIYLLASNGSPQWLKVKEKTQKDSNSMIVTLACYGFATYFISNVLPFLSYLIRKCLLKIDILDSERNFGTMLE